MKNSPDRCSEESNSLVRCWGSACEMWVTTVTWMGGHTDLFSPPILFWGLCAALLTEVALCPLWKHDPLRCVHLLWTSARKKAGGWRPGEGVGKRLENERTVEKPSDLQAFLCDYTSVEKEARHSFSQCLKLLTSTLDLCAVFFLSVKKKREKKLSCERFIWWLETVFPNTEAWCSLNQPLSTLYSDLKSRNSSLCPCSCNEIWYFGVEHSCSALPSSYANINLRTLL